MTNLNLCACMGPMYGEPLCPCRMEGLPRSEEYKTYILPQWQLLRLKNDELKKVFSENFGKRNESNV